MKFIDFFTTLVKLIDEEANLALKLFIPEEVKKGEFYLKEGQISNKISFIEEGLFKLFYQLNGEERIMLFFQNLSL